jgi:hypothetical protein
LREYDAVVGRWLIPDPFREFWSPYVAFGNNPVNVIDPRGGVSDPVIGDIKGNQIFTSNGWVTMMDELVFSSPRMTAREMYLHDAVVMQDATRFNSNFRLPRGQGYNSFEDYWTNRGFGLVIWSRGGNWYGEGSFRGGTDPAAEDIDIFLWLAASPGTGKLRTRTEEEHGIGTQPHNAVKAVHKVPPVPVDTFYTTGWGNNYYGNDAYGNGIYRIEGAEMLYFRYDSVLMSDGTKQFVKETRWAPINKPPGK